MKSPTVSKRFDSSKRSYLKNNLRKILRAVEGEAEDAGIEIERWPRSISPMTKKEIKADSKDGCGHGVYLSDSESIRLNDSMPLLGLTLNLIHELWHHVDPGADEAYINDAVVPSVYLELTGEDLLPEEWEEWRGHKEDEEDEDDDA